MNTHEQYVSLQTAKLLKQAGFDWECNWDYVGSAATEIQRLATPFNVNALKSDLFSAPTQAVAQKWLREKGYEVKVDFLYFEDAPETIYWSWQWAIKKMTLSTPYPEVFTDEDYASYEEALEAGLQKCLTLILEEKK